MLKKKRKRNIVIDGALDPRDSVCFSFQSDECSKTFGSPTERCSMSAASCSLCLTCTELSLLATMWLSLLCEQMTGCQMCFLFACLKSRSPIQNMTPAHIRCKNYGKTRTRPVVLSFCHRVPTKGMHNLKYLWVFLYWATDRLDYLSLIPFFFLFTFFLPEHSQRENSSTILVCSKPK